VPIAVIQHRQASLDTLILIGTSTGGPQALTVLLAALPRFNSGACCIVQHMPAGFTKNLSNRLNSLSAWDVQEGVDGLLLCPGRVYVAPGGFQMSLRRIHSGSQIGVQNEGSVNGHQPSVDVLFQSSLTAWTGNTIAILLTGMGKDGAVGMKHIYDSGGHTIAEAESTCVVYGMPRAAVNLGAVHAIIPLEQIAAEITQCYDKFHDID